QVIELSEKFKEDEILQFAAATQQNSEHHIAHGILAKLKEKKLPLWQSENFQYMKGIGVLATVNNKQIIVAGPNYFRQNNLQLPAMPKTIDQNIETVIFVFIDREVSGIMTLADQIRETSAGAIM